MSVFVPCNGSRGIFLAATTERVIKTTDDFELSRLERRNRILGHLAIGPEQRLYNNDPLAPVFLRLEATELGEVETQIRVEYRGDMSERSDITSREMQDTKELPFYNSFDYLLQGDELIYAETGKRLNQLLGDGVIAAEDDCKDEPEKYGYHLQRAKALAANGPAMVRWRKQNPQHVAIIASLCPPAKEVAPEIAKLGNFKVRREMSSNWILEPTNEGIRVHVFSLDHLTLGGLQAIYDELGIEVEVAGTTLQEVEHIRQLNIASGKAAKDKITSIHDAFLDRAYPYNAPHYQGVKHNHKQEQAYALVAAKPEAEELYMDVVEEVAQSLAAGSMTAGLGNILMELRSAYASVEKLPPALRLGDALSLDEARQFMDYLRRQALSEYIFGDAQAHKEFKQIYDLAGSSTGGSGGVAMAGSYAVNNNIERDGACPNSGSGVANTAEHTDASVAASMGIYGKKEFESKWCPNCLPNPKPGKKVRAWRSGEKIGCYDCGREQDVCTGQITKKGSKLAGEKLKNIVVSALDIITAGWRRAGSEIHLNTWRSKQKVAQTAQEKKQLELVIAREEAQIEQLKQVA
ncbi:hypothetical protein BVY00_00030 [bacterium G20]|nr:hypothetical protein BVY00_00030 [bacterium G20]